MVELDRKIGIQIKAIKELNRIFSAFGHSGGCGLEEIYCLKQVLSGLAVIYGDQELNVDPNDRWSDRWSIVNCLYNNEI